MTYPEYKKKVQEAFWKEDAEGKMYKALETHEWARINNFLDTTLDNLLVEVEGNCVPLRVEPSEDVSQQFRTGWNRCLEALAMGITRFKGEEKV